MYRNHYDPLRETVVPTVTDLVPENTVSYTVAEWPPFGK